MPQQAQPQQAQPQRSNSVNVAGRTDSAKPARATPGHVERNAEDAEGKVDKRLLMVRNARLIQQLLHDIPDEATKCHDKWLKKGVDTHVKKTAQRLRHRRHDELLQRLGHAGVPVEDIGELKSRQDTQERTSTAGSGIPGLTPERIKALQTCLSMRDEAD